MIEQVWGHQRGKEGPEHGGQVGVVEIKRVELGDHSPMEGSTEAPKALWFKWQHYCPSLQLLLSGQLLNGSPLHRPKAGAV